MLTYSFVHYSYPTILTVVLFFYMLLTFSFKKLYFGNNKFFILFVLWQLFTFLFYFISPYSSRLTGRGYLILATLSFYLIPQIVFFNFGAVLSKEILRKSSLFFINMNFFAIMIGIIDYFSFKLLYQAPHILKGISLNAYFRVQSYFGTPMISGLVCAASLILSYALIRNNFRKYLFLTVFTLGLILSMARGAWVAGLISLCYFLIVSKSINWKVSRRFIIFAVLILLIISVFSRFLITYLKSENFVQLHNRFLVLSNASKERNGQWISGFEVFQKYPWGVGFGLLSHKGAQSNFGITVADGNYIKILGELGTIGFTMFVTMLLYAIYITHKRKLYLVTALLIIFTIQAIGTNVFDLMYTSFLFWLLIGFSFNLSQAGAPNRILIT